MNLLDSVTNYSQDQINEKIKLFKKKIGEDVSVKSIYVDGSYYAQWFGKTKRFRVGPCLNVDDVLSELTRLYTQIK